MRPERRPNWLAYLAAFLLILGVLASLRVLLTLAGVSGQAGRWSGIANGAVTLLSIVGVNLLSWRFAQTAWGVVGRHQPDVRPSPRIADAGLAVVAGLAGYVLSLLFLLGTGLMSGEDAALYPTALATALLVVIVAGILQGRRRRG